MRRGAILIILLAVLAVGCSSVSPGDPEEPSSPEQPAEEVLALPESEPKRLNLVAVGDIMLARGVGNMYPLTT